MFFFELPPQFKHVFRYILYLLYVHSLIHRFHNEREDEEGEGGGRQRKADKSQYQIHFILHVCKITAYPQRREANPIRSLSSRIRDF